MTTQDTMSVILDHEAVCTQHFPRLQTFEACQRFMEELHKEPKELQCNDLTPGASPTD